MSSSLFVDSLVYKTSSRDFLQIKPVSAAGKMEAPTTPEVNETHKPQRLTQLPGPCPR